MERIFMFEETQEGIMTTRECRLSDSSGGTRKVIARSTSTLHPLETSDSASLRLERTFSFQDEGPNTEGSQAPTVDALLVVRYP